MLQFVLHVKLNNDNRERAHKALFLIRRMDKQMIINIKKTHPDAIIPTYGTSGAACFDLHTVEDWHDYGGSNVQYSHTYRTGLSFEIPEGYAMMVYSRSGMGFKDDVRLANCVGVIDSDYRGEVMVKLTYDRHFKKYLKGDRIAQAMIIPVTQVGFILQDELSNTTRGNGGFGSTGD